MRGRVLELIPIITKPQISVNANRKMTPRDNRKLTILPIFSYQVHPMDAMEGIVKALHSAKVPSLRLALF